MSETIDSSQLILFYSISVTDNQRIITVGIHMSFACIISNSVNNYQFTSMVTSIAVLVCVRHESEGTVVKIYLDVWNRLYTNMLTLHPPQFKQFLFVDWICFYCKMNPPHSPQILPHLIIEWKIGKINCFESFSADVKHRSNCIMYSTYSTVQQNHFFQYDSSNS